MVIEREVEARNSNGRRNKQIREGEPKGTSNNMCFTLYQIPFLGTFFEVPECVTGDREGLTPPIVGAISLGPKICMRDNWMSCHRRREEKITRFHAQLIKCRQRRPAFPRSQPENDQTSAFLMTNPNIDFAEDFAPLRGPKFPSTRVATRGVSQSLLAPILSTRGSRSVAAAHEAVGACLFFLGMEPTRTRLSSSSRLLLIRNGSS
jgi:hypothetical protein